MKGVSSKSIAMYDEDALLPISGLQHVIFCERRAALVFIERIWAENTYTAEGSIAHERAHDADTEARSDIRIARGLRLRSLELGLSGMADIVEFHLARDLDGPPGIALEGNAGKWHPVPVEYKRGRLREEEGYEIQLCAQALCLEEMLGTAIPKGFIYYGKTRRRLEIVFDEKLRSRTREAAARLHALIESGETPKAEITPRCERCSLIDLCLPAVTLPRRSASSYLRKAISEAEGE